MSVVRTQTFGPLLWCCVSVVCQEFVITVVTSFICLFALSRVSPSLGSALTAFCRFPSSGGCNEDQTQGNINDVPGSICVYVCVYVCVCVPVILFLCERVMVVMDPLLLQCESLDLKLCVLMMHGGVGG